LSPNAIKAYRALGSKPRLRRRIRIGPPAGAQLEYRQIISQVYRKGVYEREFGAPYLSIHRADLVDILRRALPDRIFRLGARCTEVETATPARARVSPMARKSKLISWSAPTAFIRPSAAACSVSKPRDSPGLSAGVGWCRSTHSRPA